MADESVMPSLRRTKSQSVMAKPTVGKGDAVAFVSNEDPGSVKGGALLVAQTRATSVMRRGGLTGLCI
jgi:hypothetical protein